MWFVALLFWLILLYQCIKCWYIIK
jgi:hypothetical protein